MVSFSSLFHLTAAAATDQTARAWHVAPSPGIPLLQRGEDRWQRTSRAGSVPRNGTPRRSSTAPVWQLSGCCVLLRHSKSSQRWELSLLSSYLEQHNLKADYVSLWRVNDLKCIKKSYPTVDYPEKYLVMRFVSQHAVELCGSVGQNEKTNTLFIWNDYSGEGDKKQKVVTGIHKGCLWRYPHFLPSHTLFPESSGWFGSHSSLEPPLRVRILRTASSTLVNKDKRRRE